MAEVQKIDLDKALEAAQVALAGRGHNSWVQRVSVVLARRENGVDVETEYRWEMGDRG